MRRTALLLVIAIALSVVPSAHAQRSEYRAFWVDTFNTLLNNHTDVLAVVNNAKAAKANAIFAQVRRRGDSWYLNTLEPMADRTPIQPGFDPLQDLITTAHAEGIEVHAFVIMSAIWGRAPNLFPPENPNHAFNLHGGFDAPTNTIITGPNNWLTRTLLPDTTGTNVSIRYQGHRFGNDFWIDFGHPEAAAYTANVVRHLVQNYDIDGLHLDRIRYPEISTSGQTPSTGTSIGYNPTSISRFNLRHSRTGTPAQNDALWNQWRRDQVTNIVRRVYLEANELKPQIRVSAALIAFGGGPVCPFGVTCANDREVWEKSASAEAYWRVYQDWRAWTEEGIIDLAMPMVYKAEHTAAQVTQFNQWNEWTKNHQYDRGAVMGIGALSNAIEGTLRQTRRALTPSTQGKLDFGVIYFSMATSNIAVTANPFSQPPGVNTPIRPFAEFASGLTTGKSVNGLTFYEPATLVPIFKDPATIPVLPWKSAPTRGHLKGFARRADGSAVDSGSVTFLNLDTNATKSSVSDGNGFFGGVDLAPGSNVARVTLGSESFFTCPADVVAGFVSTADAKRVTIEAPAHLRRPMDLNSCSAAIYAGTPTVSHSCERYEVAGVRSDGQLLTAPFDRPLTTIEWTITGPLGATATATQRIEVFDAQPPAITAPASVVVATDAGLCSATVNVGQATASDNCALPVNSVTAMRSDGLPLSAPYPKGTTTIEWTATDAANLTASVTQTVTVLDQEAPVISNVSVNREELWPPLHNMVTVRVNYSTSDACSAVTSSLSVTSNEPVDGTGDGDTSPDWEVISDREVRLRAERAGTGTGRIYTITVTAVDADGNASTKSVAVFVPLNQGEGPK